jgi:hypothetical protein
MAAGETTLYTQNNSLTIDLSEGESLDDHCKDYLTDTDMRLEQVTY